MQRGLRNDVLQALHQQRTLQRHQRTAGGEPVRSASSLILWEPSTQQRPLLATLRGNKEILQPALSPPEFTTTTRIKIHCNLKLNQLNRVYMNCGLVVCLFWFFFISRWWFRP